MTGYLTDGHDGCVAVSGCCFARLQAQGLQQVPVCAVRSGLAHTCRCSSGLLCRMSSRCSRVAALRPTDVDLPEPQAARPPGPENVLLCVLTPRVSECGCLQDCPRALAMTCAAPSRVGTASGPGWRVLSGAPDPCRPVSVHSQPTMHSRADVIAARLRLVKQVRNASA